MHLPPVEDSLPLEAIGSATMHEKSIWRGHISSLHPWWSRRPLTIARAAVYYALLGAKDINPDFLTDLCAYPPVAEALRSARTHMMEEHARRLSSERGREITVPQVEQGRVPSPRVLDMFAGGGSIPLEAMRLGAESYALDLNPVAYLIELCTLRYPQLYGAANRAIRGTGPDGSWAGLGAEVQHWATWVNRRIQVELAHFYPQIDTGTGKLTPLGYIWGRTIQCVNPACGTTIPLMGMLPLRKRGRRSTVLLPTYDVSNRRVHFELLQTDSTTDLEVSSLQGLHRGAVACPACGTVNVVTRREMARPNSEIIGLIGMPTGSQDRVFLVAASLSPQAVPGDTAVHERLSRLLSDAHLSLPDEPLPPEQVLRISKYKFTHYTDLFTPRQQLFLLTAICHIHAAHLAMLEQRIDQDRARAVISFLALAVSNLTRLHNAFSRWNGARGTLLSAFAYPTISFAPHYVEVNPFLPPYDLPTATQHAATVIEANADTGRPADVRQGSATELPFEDEFFDAIVTDPPYYDAVPYADLADFFYVWLRRALGHLYSDAFRHELSPKSQEIVLALHRYGDRNEALTAYESLMAAALSEAYRVLKPDRLLSVLFSSRSNDALQIYLDIAQRAGFELVSTNLFRTERLAISGREEPDQTDSGSFILTFRKSLLAAKLPESSADAQAVIALASQDQPVLYAGLAEFILAQGISPEDMGIPSDYQGTDQDRAAEWIAACEDPRVLIESLFPLHIRRKIVREQGWLDPDNPNEDPSAVILRHFGFAAPRPPQGGIVQAIRTLHQLASRAQNASERNLLAGLLQEGMAYVESVLRQATLAWGLAVIGPNPEPQIRAFAEVEPTKKLAMGDVKSMFCSLPDGIVRSAFVERSQALFGRPHIYKPRPFEGKLNKLVNLRNRVAHNLDNFLTETPVPELRHEIVDKLRLAETTLQELRDKGAIPMLARAIQETRDLYDRRTVLLHLEDDAERKIYTIYPIMLGQNYFYLGDSSNPIPVDPVIVPLQDVQSVIKLV